MTEYSYDEFNSLINITRLIINKYNEIYTYESINEKESLEYENKVNELRKLLLIEEMVYNTIDINILSKSIYTNVDMFSESKLVHDFIASFSMSDKRIIQRRIFKKIVERIEKEQNPHDKLTGQKELENTVKEDYVNTLLVILNEYINNENLYNISNYFLKLKYNISAIFGFVEKDFLANNFSINSNLKWNYQRVASDNNIDRNNLISIILTESFNAMNYFIAHIKNLDEHDFDNPTVFASGMLGQIFLRTSFLFAFLSEDLKQKFIASFSLETDEEKEIWESNNSKDIISTAMKEFENDKNLPQNNGFNLQ